MICKYFDAWMSGHISFDLLMNTIENNILFFIRGSSQFLFECPA